MLISEGEEDLGHGRGGALGVSHYCHAAGESEVSDAWHFKMLVVLWKKRFAKARLND